MLDIGEWPPSQHLPHAIKQLFRARNLGLDCDATVLVWGRQEDSSL